MKLFHLAQILMELLPFAGSCWKKLILLEEVDWSNCHLLEEFSVLEFTQIFLIHDIISNFTQT